MKLKSILPKQFYQKYIKPLQIYYIDSRGKRIYSQEGEDILIERMIGKKRHGFYIDIGAHHPTRFSNTYYFYRQGWSGINIEPNPDLFVYFERQRRRDINLNIGLSSKPQPLKYYSFDEPAMNTFSADAVQGILDSNHTLKGTQMIQTTSLAKVLEDYPIPTKIDFMSIDAEGLDFDILQSNNWDKCRPDLILIETKAETLKQVMESEITLYLEQKKYTVISKLHNTTFYRYED